MNDSRDKLSTKTVVERFEEQIPVIFRYFHSSKTFDFEEMNITLPQLMVLEIIQKKGSPNMTDIAGDLSVTLSNVTGMIDRLIESGYVERVDDPQDRRIVRVRLTVKGKNTTQKAFEQRQRCLNQVFGKLSCEDQKSLLKITEKLVDAIKQEGGK
ncbi:MAG: MarR family transcriptional regulator [Candidatus Margulisiibacteriota bacterium]